VSGIVDQTLSVAGQRTRLRIVGSGPHALVLFPAVMDTGAAFGRLQLQMRRRLGEGIASVAVDLPGYADEAAEVPAFSVWPGFCAALMRALEGLFAGGFVLAGNSSGAVAATECALESARAAGLAWICWCDWRAHAPRDHELLCPADASGVERLLAHAWHKPPVLTEEAAQAMLAASARFRRHVASFDAEQHRARLARYRGPFLAVAGASDRLVPWEQARAVVESRNADAPMPSVSGARDAGEGARFECIAESGHYPHREQPAALASVLAEFARPLLLSGTAHRPSHGREYEYADFAD
jgi:pimeloyl-ACP methyl ester carboxylesterase